MNRPIKKSLQFTFGMSAALLGLAFVFPRSGAALFGLCALCSLSALFLMASLIVFLPKPQLVIGEKGLSYRRTAFSALRTTA